MFLVAANARGLPAANGAFYDRLMSLDRGCQDLGLRLVEERVFYVYGVVKEGREDAAHNAHELGVSSVRGEGADPGRAEGKVYSHLPIFGYDDDIPDALSPSHQRGQG